MQKWLETQCTCVHIIIELALVLFPPSFSIRILAHSMGSIQGNNMVLYSPEISPLHSLIPGSCTGIFTLFISPHPYAAKITPSAKVNAWWSTRTLLFHSLNNLSSLVSSFCYISLLKYRKRRALYTCRWRKATCSMQGYPLEGAYIRGAEYMFENKPPPSVDYVYC